MENDPLEKFRREPRLAQQNEEPTQQTLIDVKELERLKGIERESAMLLKYKQMPSRKLVLPHLSCSARKRMRRELAWEDSAHLLKVRGIDFWGETSLNAVLHWFLGGSTQWLSTRSAGEPKLVLPHFPCSTIR
jgi:hypothetical protein